MNRELVQYFFEECTKALAFVVKDYNFAPPQLEINDKINFAFVIFMGKNLAIEMILDERGKDKGVRNHFDTRGRPRRERQHDASGSLNKCGR